MVRGQFGAHNLTAQVLDAVGRAIVADRWPGEGMTEAALAQQHAVSRSVVREAVKMLAAKGVLRTRQRAGIRVTPQAEWNWFDRDILNWLVARGPDLTAMRHFAEVRLAIEPMAAELAATHGGAEAARRVGAGFDRLRQADRRGGDAIAADIAFHVAVLDAAANPFISHFRDLIAVALRTSVGLTNRLTGRTASLRAHGAVLQAIVAGDGTAARGAMTRIVQDAADVIQQAGRMIPATHNGAGQDGEV